MPTSDSVVDCRCNAPKDKAHTMCYGVWISGLMCTKCGQVLISQLDYDEALAKFAKRNGKR